MMWIPGLLFAELTVASLLDWFNGLGYRLPSSRKLLIVILLKNHSVHQRKGIHSYTSNESLFPYHSGHYLDRNSKFQSHRKLVGLGGKLKNSQAFPSLPVPPIHLLIY
jgi:hypothetical protein